MYGVILIGTALIMENAIFVKTTVQKNVSIVYIENIKCAEWNLEQSKRSENTIIL